MGQDRVHPDRDDGFRTSFGAVFRDMCQIMVRLPAISRGVRLLGGIPRAYGVNWGDISRRGGGSWPFATKTPPSQTGDSVMRFGT